MEKQLKNRWKSFKEANWSSGGKTVWRMLWQKAHTPIIEANIVQNSIFNEGISGRFVEESNGFW